MVEAGEEHGDRYAGNQVRHVERHTGSTKAGKSYSGRQDMQGDSHAAQTPKTNAGMGGKEEDQASKEVDMQQETTSLPRHTVKEADHAESSRK